MRIIRKDWKSIACLLLVAMAIVACDSGDDDDADSGHTWKIDPGPQATEDALLAFTNAQPGDTIHFKAGRFTMESTLTLTETQTGITISGEGPDESILEFNEQNDGNGHNGIMTNAGDLLIKDLAIENTVGDGIKTHNGENVVIRNTRVEWTGGPDPSNGPYAIYPVLCKNVLVEDSIAIGASDSGIYVGQSDHVIVRRNRVEYNVTGIEIENSTNSDVYENIVTNNTGGILVFDMPYLPVQGGNTTRVFNNQIYENNTDNFAPEGNIVGIVPAGTGIFIFANDKVEVFDNVLRDNQSFQFLIGSFTTMMLVNGQSADDPNFDPDPQTIYIHDNEVSGGGDNPQGDVGTLIASLVDADPMPTLVWDGVLAANKLDEEGQIKPEDRICFKNNGEVTAVDLDVPNFPSNTPAYGLEQFDCEFDPLPPISFPGSE